MATKQMGGKTPQKKTASEKGNSRTADKNQSSGSRSSSSGKSMDK
jgi:hypothetical protein